LLYSPIPRPSMSTLFPYTTLFRSLFLTRNEKALTFHNLISYLLLPGLIYSYFVQLGVHKRLAWWWMCLLPSAYCYATSTTRQDRSEEHTSELQSQSNLVCRLLLDK